MKNSNQSIKKQGIMYYGADFKCYRKVGNKFVESVPPQSERECKCIKKYDTISCSANKLCHYHTVHSPKLKQPECKRCGKEYVIKGVQVCNCTGILDWEQRTYADQDIAPTTRISNDENYEIGKRVGISIGHVEARDKLIEELRGKIRKLKKSYNGSQVGQGAKMAIDEVRGLLSEIERGNGE